jgi:hypothetical protein
MFSVRFTMSQAASDVRARRISHASLLAAAGALKSTLVLPRMSKRLTFGRFSERGNKPRLSISFPAESEAARLSSLG